jgi:RNA recognition motif-containing protein
MKLYVGNLPFNHNDIALQDLFTPYGEVVSSKVITDHQSGRSRGFGFVEMGSRSEGQKAMEAMNGSSVEGRALVVNEARQEKKRTWR